MTNARHGSYGASILTDDESSINFRLPCGKTLRQASAEERLAAVSFYKSIVEDLCRIDGTLAANEAAGRKD